MAGSNTTPRIRIAQTPEEDAFAKAQMDMMNLLPHRCIEDIEDEQLLDLLEEPEMMIRLTPLERELWARLGAALEVYKAEVEELHTELLGQWNDR